MSYGLFFESAYCAGNSLDPRSVTLASDFIRFDQRQTFQCQRNRIKPLQKADTPQWIHLKGINLVSRCPDDQRLQI
jgi:hypothetical protein